MITNNQVSFSLLLSRLRKAVETTMIVATIIFLTGSQAFSEEAVRSGQLSIVFENDVFFNTDRDYTNGVALVWVPAGKPAPNWIMKIAHWIPWFPIDGITRHGYMFGQNMYTPHDLTRADPPLDDRPYAGWLYGTTGVGVETDHQLDLFAITVGVLGPASYAEQTQKFIHKLVHTTDPQGWDTQLGNELGIYATYQHSWRELAAKTLLGLDFDVAPHLGGALGNVYTYADAGFTLRYGEDLPRDYGPPRVQPGVLGSVFFEPTDRFSWYLFGSVEGRAVARNIFLDGNTFKDSRSVEKEPFVADLQWGIVLTWHDYRLSFTDLIRTPEFEGLKSNDHFGSICFSMGI
jgi:hypothetical protein